MATSKKTHTTKKASSKNSKVVKARPLTWRFYVVTIGIFIVAVTTMIVLAMFASHVLTSQANKDRLDRINEIYATLAIDNEAYPRFDSQIFGDKRTDTSDKNRTQSSYVTYRHADTVNNTVAELDAKIKAAGFEFIDEPYPGSTFVEYRYKSPNGEYIVLNVASKPYTDAFYNNSVMNKDGEVPESVYAMDKNAGPSVVTIKVNLDDNNE